MAKSNQGTPWWVAGDLNGFFGLFSNSLTNFLTAIGLIAFAISMPSDLVFGKIVPAAAISIAGGNIILAYFAKTMSVREKRDNVTAMPYGLSVPHYFAVSLGVMLPIYIATKDWTTAWATGIVWNFIQGLIMLAGAFVGPYIKKYVPRAAMLGALAGFALTFISGNPIGEVYGAPYIGLICFTILMVGWLAHKRLPLNIPAGAFAILVGTLIAWATGYMKPQAVSEAISGFNIPFPSVTLNLFAIGFKQIGPFLPAAIPLGIYDFLESLDNLESAEAAGEHYPIALSMAVPAILTIIGSFIGSVFPTIIYIGHPGWKATGARIGYSIATAVGILVLSYTGLLRLVSSIIPLVALLPILVYIGMVIGTQAFSSTKARYMPAIVLAFLPFVGSFLTTKLNSTISAVNTALAEAGANISVAFTETAEPGVAAVTNALMSSNGIPFLGWASLSKGDIIISMLIATIVIFIIDRRYTLSIVYCLISATLAFFGIIHSSSFGFNSAPQVTLGYLGMAVVLLFVSFYRKDENIIPPDALDDK